MPTTTTTTRSSSHNHHHHHQRQAFADAGAQLVVVVVVVVVVVELHFDDGCCGDLWYLLPATRYATEYHKVKSCFFRPAGRFRAGLARPMSAPLDSPDGESPGDPPAASLALALAPWPVWRAPKVEKIESVLRVTLPVPRCLAGYVKPSLR